MADEAGVSIDEIVRPGSVLYPRDLHGRKDRKLM
jgi:hypothetical protein